MKNSVFNTVLSCVVLFGGTSLARGGSVVTLQFDGITSNKLADVTTGESQLFVDVIDAGLAAGGVSQVEFLFRNTGPNLSSITDVYFDDGTLLGISSISGSSGVSFSQGASPGDLPGGNNASPPFQTTAGFVADSDPAAQPNGVNPGEWLSIVFDLINGKTYSDTIAALFNPSNDANADANGDGDPDGTLRIGIHVQGFLNGGSESFVNVPPSGSPPGEPGGGSVVPEPSSFALLSIASLSMMSYGFVRRRKPEDESQPQS